MTAKQWLLVTLVVVLNIIIFGALLGGGPKERHSPPTPTWTPHPTFTPKPFATATAIVMPTLPPQPTPVSAPSATPFVHVVSQEETLESIAKEYGTSVYILRMINRIPESAGVSEGQQLVIPVSD